MMGIIKSSRSLEDVVSERILCESKETVIHSLVRLDFISLTVGGVLKM